MPSKTTEMLIRAGIIPRETVRQLERWKVFEEGTADKVGEQAVSLEKDSEEAERFTQELRVQMEKDSQTIRETELAETGEATTAWVIWAGGQIEEGVEVVVDRFERVHVPLTPDKLDGYLTVSAISFNRDLDYAAALKVLKAEPLFKDETPVALVCTLEGGDHGRDEVPQERQLH